MISVATIKKVLAYLEIENFEIKNHFIPLMGQLHLMFNKFVDDKTVSYELSNINPWVVSWDMLSKSDQYLFVSIARNRHADMFKRFQPLSAMQWADFDTPEQAAIMKACEDALRSSFTLNNGGAIAYNYKRAYIEAVKERGSEEAKQVIEALRAA